MKMDHIISAFTILELIIVVADMEIPCSISYDDL